MGIFRRRLHFVDPDARTFKFGGLLYHFARCNAVTLLDDDLDRPAWQWCTDCAWPSEAIT